MLRSCFSCIEDAKAWSRLTFEFFCLIFLFNCLHEVDWEFEIKCCGSGIMYSIWKLVVLWQADVSELTCNQSLGPRNYAHIWQYYSMTKIFFAPTCRSGSHKLWHACSVKNIYLLSRQSMHVVPDQKRKSKFSIYGSQQIQ